MATLSKDRVREIIQNAPPEVGAESIVNELRNRGYTLEGFNETPKQVVTEGQTQKEQRRGFFGRLREDAEKRADKIGEIEAATASGQQGKISESFQKFGQGTGLLTDLVGQSLVSLGRGAVGAAKIALPKAAEESIARSIKDQNEAFADDPVVQQGLELAETGVESYLIWREQHPKEALNIEASLNIADAMGLGLAGQFSKKSVKKTLQEAFEATARGTVNLSDDATLRGKSLLDTFKVRKSQRAVERISENISPKLTAQETQRIISEGRVTRGKKSRIFGQRPDIVDQSESVKRAAQVIEERIPKASRMDDFKLSEAIDGEITTIARSLSDDMSRTSFPPRIASKIDEVWNKTKTRQQGTADFGNFPGSKKAQKSFEAYLHEMKTPVRGADGKFRPKTLDDLWEIRKRYDKSIPSRVKQADTLSDASLQFQKEMWLENRAILNNAINSTANGLGGRSLRDFSDMSNLYMARQNIITKSKIATERKSGLVTKKDVLKYGLTVGGGMILGKQFGAF